MFAVIVRYLLKNRLPLNLNGTNFQFPKPQTQNYMYMHLHYSALKKINYMYKTFEEIHQLSSGPLFSSAEKKYSFSNIISSGSDLELLQKGKKVQMKCKHNNGIHQPPTKYMYLDYPK